MKKILLKILYSFSKVIFAITPKEFYKNQNSMTLKSKIVEDLTKETYE